MDKKFFNLFATCTIFFLILSTAHAGFFSDFFGTNPITDFVDLVTAPAQSFVGTIIGAVASIPATVGNVITSIVSPQPAPPTTIPTGEIFPSADRAGGVAPSNYNSWNPSGSIGSQIGSNTTAYSSTNGIIPVYKENKTRFVEIKETGFSQLELTNLILDTASENDEVLSGTYVHIFHEISNIGSEPGNTKWQHQIECYPYFGPARNFVPIYQVEQRTEWITSGTLGGGTSNSFLTVWFVPSEKYLWGGKCKVKSELSENVRIANFVENLFCTVITWSSGETTEDCSTVTEPGEDIVKTKGAVLKEIEFDILPRVPKLRARVVETVGFN